MFDAKRRLFEVSFFADSQIEDRSLDFNGFTDIQNQRGLAGVGDLFLKDRDIRFNGREGIEVHRNDHLCADPLGSDRRMVDSHRVVTADR